MSRASDHPEMPQRKRNRKNTPDVLRAMPVRASVEGGKICNQTMVREMLQIFGTAGIVDETGGFGLDFEKTELLLECHSIRGTSVLKKDGFETCL